MNTHSDIPMDKASSTIESISEPETLSSAERARLEAAPGVIFDVQRYSLHDGPGLRTNVFFKGCPLRCDWCSNPESQNMAPELVLFASNCIACGQFAQPCPVAWQNRSDKGWTEEMQAEYSTRAEACPASAIRWCGVRRSAGDVIREVLRDAPFYEEGGGMTLTGGEPTTQPQMAEALLRLGKSECISTAMETCGYTPWEVLARLLPYLDLILFDVKHVDDAAHRAYTGVGNELILANLRRLVALRAPVVVRVPLIPGFNATHEGIQAIAELVLGLNGTVVPVELLPYHAFGRAKYEALARAYAWEGQRILTDGEVESLAEIMKRRGLVVTVGG